MTQALKGPLPSYLSPLCIYTYNYIHIAICTYRHIHTCYLFVCINEYIYICMYSFIYICLCCILLIWGPQHGNVQGIKAHPRLEVYRLPTAPKRALKGSAPTDKPTMHAYI